MCIDIQIGKVAAGPVTVEHCLMALRYQKPNITSQENWKLEDWHRKFGGNQQNTVLTTTQPDRSCMDYIKKSKLFGFAMSVLFFSFTVVLLFGICKISKSKICTYVS